MNRWENSSSIKTSKSVAMKENLSSIRRDSGRTCAPWRIWVKRPTPKSSLTSGKSRRRRSVSLVRIYTYVAQQTAEKIYDIISTSDANNKLRDDYQAYIDQESQGVGDTIGEAFKGIGEGLGAMMGGMGGIVSVASSAMCVLIVLAPSMMGGGGGGVRMNRGGVTSVRGGFNANALGKLKYLSMYTVR